MTQKIEVIIIDGAKEATIIINEKIITVPIEQRARGIVIHFESLSYSPIKECSDIEWDYKKDNSPEQITNLLKSKHGIDMHDNHSEIIHEN